MGTRILGMLFLLIRHDPLIREDPTIYHVLMEHIVFSWTVGLFNK